MPRTTGRTVVAHEFPRKEGEVVRALVSDFRGRRLLHLRTFFLGRDGRFRATQRGITVTPEQLQDLELAVRALREAHETVETPVEECTKVKRAISEPP